MKAFVTHAIFRVTVYSNLLEATLCLTKNVCVRESCKRPQESSCKPLCAKRHSITRLPYELQCEKIPLFAVLVPRDKLIWSLTPVDMPFYARNAF
jgi:hypothetical protein